MKRVVLIVDDCDETRAALQLVLEAHGYDVASAPDGARGLALLSLLGRPTVAIIDYSMPAMSGREFIAHARRDPTTADIPIIMLSGDASAASVTTGLFGFVRKPCDTTELMGLVARAFAEHDRVTNPATSARSPANRSRA